LSWSRRQVLQVSSVALNAGDAQAVDVAQLRRQLCRVRGVDATAVLPDVDVDQHVHRGLPARWWDPFSDRASVTLSTTVTGRWPGWSRTSRANRSAFPMPTISVVIRRRRCPPGA